MSREMWSWVNNLLNFTMNCFTAFAACVIWFVMAAAITLLAIGLVKLVKGEGK